MGTGASFMGTIVQEETYKHLLKTLGGLTDKQLQEYAKIAANNLLLMPEYHREMLFQVLLRTCLRL
jgi:hypothetical protein